jgi:hypothetical protein
VVGKRVFIVKIVFVNLDALAVIPIEPGVIAYPDEAHGILDHAQHVRLGEAVFRVETVETPVQFQCRTGR